MSKSSCVALAVIPFLLLGCAYQEVQRTYTSEPETQRVSNAVFDTRIDIEKQDNPFFVSFLLTLTNKTETDLTIDWNRTRYLHKGQDMGVFVFKGIDPESVKSGIPKEIVAPGATLSKRISPIRTLAFRSKRERIEPGQDRFFAGILPGGTNTIRLVVEQADHLIREESVSFNLTTGAPKDTVALQGTIAKKDLEGGFFAIDGDDGKTYEPINLPEAFRRNGMRVKATVRIRNDVGSIHMMGDMVEIVDITAR